MGKDFDLDLSDDFDFDKEFESISGGSSFSEPPKNAREAALRTLKDSKSGFIGGFKGDSKSDLAKKVLEDSIPSKLSNEYDTVKDMYGEVSNTLKDEIEGIKKESKKAVKAINKLVPTNSKLSKILSSISSKLGEDSEHFKKISKEQEQQTAINEAILATLGQQADMEKQNEAIRQTIEEKRHLSTTELLKNIYAELKMSGNFQREITNNYYRKSLEIQFKQLYTMQEQLGIIKSGFETFKNQFEAIVKNTGLPEVIKIKNSEQIIKSIGDRYREELANTFYKNFDPIGNLKERWISNIKNFSNNFKEGLSGGTDLLNMMSDMQDMGMSASKGHMIGNFIGNTLRKKLIGKVSSKLYSTEKGKRATMSIKDMLADPDGYLKTILENETGNNISSKMKKSMASMLRTFTNISPTQNRAVFDRDINGATIFDNRTKDSIVKVIPTLLAKIYSEIRSLRLKDKDPTKHELFYDYKKQDFYNREATVNNLKDSIGRTVKNTLGGSINTIENILTKYGGIKGSLLKEFKSNLIKYLYNPRSRINIDSLAGKDFLDLFSSKKHKIIKNAIYSIKKEFAEDPDLQDEYNYTIKAIKAGLPNVNNIAKELVDSGRLDIAKQMGFVTTDIFTGSITSNNESTSEYVNSTLSNLGKVDYSDEYLDKLSKENERKLKSGIASVKSTIKDAYSKVKSLYSNHAEKYVKEYYNKADEISKPIIDKMSSEISDGIDRLKETDAYKSADAQAKELMESELAIKIIEKYKKAHTIINNIDKKYNISTKSKWLKDYSKNKIMGLYKNENGERENLINRIKDFTYFKSIRSGITNFNNDIVNYLNDKETGSNIYSKYKGKISNAIKGGKEKLVTDANKERARDLYSKASNMVTKTLKDSKLTFDKIKDPEKRKELILQLKDDYLKSKDYLNSNIVSFKDYLIDLGFDLGSNPEETLTDILTDKKSNSPILLLENKLKDARIEQLTTALEKIGDKGLVNVGKEMFQPSAENMEQLKQEFFNSPEYKSGAVQDFQEWCKALGYNINNNKIVRAGKAMFKAAKAGYRFMNSDFFKKTRELDRKMFKSIPSVLGKLFKTTGKIGLGVGKIGGKISMSALGALSSIGMNTADAISAVLLSKMSNSIDVLTNSTLGEKNKEKLKERANSWKDRIKLFSKDKDEKGVKGKKRGFMGTVANFVKEHPSLKLGLGIATMVGLLKALNINMEDVKDFSSGIFKGIKFIGTALSGIWNFITHPLDSIKNGASSLWKGIKGMFGFGDDSSDSNSSDETEGSMSGAELAGMGVAGLGAVYAGKKVYNIGKTVAKPVLSVGKFAASGVSLGAKALTEKSLLKVPKTPNISTGATALTEAKPSFLSKLKDLLFKALEKVSWVLPNSVMETAKSKLNSGMSYISKYLPSWESMKSNFDKLIKVAKRKSPKIATTALTKLSAKLAAYFGSAATGVGVIATLGFALWDIGWIIKYWLVDGMSFWPAVGKQLLGLDITDEDMEASDKDIQSIQANNTSFNGVKYEGNKLYSYKNSEGITVITGEQQIIDRFGKDAAKAAVERWKEEQKGLTELASTTNTNNSSSTKNDIKQAIQPVNNVNFNNSNGTANHISNDKQSLGGQQQTSLVPPGKGSPSMPSSSLAERAAQIASERASSKSTGKCAMRVRQALEAGGYKEPPGRPGSAYQYATTGFINKYGFERLNVDPLSYKPKVGDISITDRFNNHQHGHIAIYDGKNWVSDFRQRGVSIYKDLPKDRAKDLISIWRDPGKGENGVTVASREEASVGGMQDVIGNETVANNNLSKYNTPNTTSNPSNNTASYASYTPTQQKQQSSASIAQSSPSVNMNETNNILAKQLEVQMKQLEVQINMEKALAALASGQSGFDPKKLKPDREPKPMPTPSIGINRRITA